MYAPRRRVVIQPNAEKCAEGCHAATPSEPQSVTITDPETVGIILLCFEAWELRDTGCTAARIVKAWWDERDRR